MNQQIQEDRKFLTTTEVCQRYRKSARTIARWPATRRFPRPALNSKGSENLWLLQDIIDWENSEMSARY